jgi:hypothetical protein
VPPKEEQGKQKPMRKDFKMTLAEKKQYAKVNELKKFLEQLKGQKFQLDCGHHVTFHHFFGNDITIRNGKKLKIICSFCGY